MQKTGQQRMLALGMLNKPNPLREEEKKDKPPCGRENLFRLSPRREESRRRTR
jgi:hypothetical protein